MKKAIVTFLILLSLISLFCLASFSKDSDFKLFLQPNPNENNIKLEWDLSNNDEKQYTFRAYRKKESENEYQGVSTTNLEATSSTRVRVLNVYPQIGEMVTFTYKDGKTENLNKAASLKVWMEGGTVKSESGETTTFDNYGRNPKNNEQVVFVDMIDMNSFNQDPSVLWDYDVCMFGTWDYNGHKDLVDSSKVELEKYIKSGKGVLCGHDTLNVENPKFWSLKEYFKIDKYTEFKGTENIKIDKKGLLTNFPWEIGEIGTILNVPYSHNKQAAYGDIWIRFDGRDNNPDNFFLTSYQNTAMIQTGHSDCESTEDERKVLANTLFYLNQLTNATSVIDNGGQDLDKPDKVTEISNTVLKSNNKANIKWKEANDNGTRYSYYVEAVDKDTNVLRSNEEQTEIKTGIEGYNYIIDNNANTEAGFEITTNDKEIKGIELDWNKDNYIHIRSIDKGKNYSETEHYKIKYENIIEGDEDPDNDEPNNDEPNNDEPDKDIPDKDVPDKSDSNQDIDKETTKDDYNKNNKNISTKKEDTTISNKILPNTGKNLVFLIIILVLLVYILIKIKLYKSKYKDVK